MEDRIYMRPWRLSGAQHNQKWHKRQGEKHGACCGKKRLESSDAVNSGHSGMRGYSDSRREVAKGVRAGFCWLGAQILCSKCTVVPLPLLMPAFDRSSLLVALSLVDIVSAGGGGDGSADVVGVLCAEIAPP